MTASVENQKELITRVVRQAIVKILPHLTEAEIAGSGSLKDHGADSVDRIEIIVSIMNQLEIHEPVSSFSSIPNIDAMVDFLCKARQK